MGKSSEEIRRIIDDLNKLKAAGKDTGDSLGSAFSAISARMRELKTSTDSAVESISRAETAYQRLAKIANSPQSMSGIFGFGSGSGSQKQLLPGGMNHNNTMYGYPPSVFRAQRLMVDPTQPSPLMDKVMLSSDRTSRQAEEATKNSKLIQRVNDREYDTRRAEEARLLTENSALIKRIKEKNYVILKNTEKIAEETSGQAIDIGNRDEANIDLDGVSPRALLIDRIRGKNADGGYANTVSAGGAEGAVKYLEKLGIALDNIKVGKIQEVGDGVNQLINLKTSGKEEVVLQLNNITGAITRVGKGAREAKKEVVDFEKTMKTIQAKLPANTNIKSGVMGMLNKYNFSPDDLQDSTTEASTGVTRLSFKKINEETGAIEKLTMHTTKYGHVLVDTQRRFASFGQALAANTLKVLQWSIAVSLIYGPAYKFQELMVQMIDNEAKLAEVMTALGSATETTSEVFAAIAESSDAAGRSINEVMQGYAQAYRATGAISDSSERFVVANQLLADSLTLSKLSTLTGAEAIDTLTAALEQTAPAHMEANENLLRGTALLDKWVRTTKVANVDMTALSTAFGVFADSAETVGIDVDMLNGMVAVVAQNSNVAGREVANISRAIVAGFSSDKGIESLQALGVAVEDLSTGVRRSVPDIIAQLNDMYKAGILTEDQLSVLGADIGGGNRRKAPTISLIKDFDQVIRISQESSAAMGDSAAALDRQLGTVQTALTRLGNSFQNLAQTMGAEGGILDVFKLLVNLLTGVTNGLTGMLGIMGKSGTFLMGTLITSQFLKGKTPGERQGYSARIGEGASRIAQGFFNQRGLEWMGYNTSRLSESQMLDNRLNMVTGNPDRSSKASQFGTWTAQNMKKTAAAGAVLFPAVSNALQGNWEQAGGNIAGGILGALATGGNPVGAAIGTAIGEAFVNTALHTPKWSSLFAGVTDAAPVDTKTLKLEELSKKQEALLNEGYGKIGGGNVAMGKLRAGVMGGAFNLANQISGTGNKINSEQAMLMMGQMPSWLGSAFGGNKQGSEWYDQFYSLQNEEQALTGGPQAEFTKLQREVLKEAGSTIENTMKQYKNNLMKDLISKKINKTDYNAGIESLESYNVVASTYYAAAGQSLIDFDKTDEIEDQADAFDMYANVIIKGGQEVINVINQQAQEIQELVNAGASETEINAKRASMNQFMTETYKELAEAIKESSVQLPTIVNAPELTRGQGEFVQKRGRELLQEDVDAAVSKGLISALEGQEYIKALEPFLVQLKDGFSKATQLRPEDYNEALSELMKKYPGSSSQGIGFQEFDLNNADFTQMMGGYEPLKKIFESYGYKAEETSMIPVLKDGIIQPMTKDWKLVQLLLQKILDVEQKQLDGMYNLPEGSSFWVPYQAAKLYQGEGSGDIQSIIDALISSLGGVNEIPGTSGEIPSLPFPSDDKTSMQRFREAEARSMESYANYVPKTKSPYLDSMQKFHEADARSMASRINILTGEAGVGDPILKGTRGQGVVGAHQPLSTTIPQTRLNLNINSTSTILLDGRQLATAVKTYLLEDLIRFSSGSSAVTRTLTVA